MQKYRIQNLNSPGGLCGPGYLMFYDAVFMCFYTLIVYGSDSETIKLFLFNPFSTAFLYVTRVISKLYLPKVIFIYKIHEL